MIGTFSCSLAVEGSTTPFWLVGASPPACRRAARLTQWSGATLRTSIYVPLGVIFDPKLGLEPVWSQSR